MNLVEANLDYTQALFFSLSNWETGANEMHGRARDWSGQGRRPRGSPFSARLCLSLVPVSQLLWTRKEGDCVQPKTNGSRGSYHQDILHGNKSQDFRSLCLFYLLVVFARWKPILFLTVTSDEFVRFSTSSFVRFQLEDDTDKLKVER